MNLILNPVIAIFALSISVVTANPSFASDVDNPGADQPDDSFTLGEAIYPTHLENISPNIDEKSKIAVLDNGYSRESVLFMSLYLPLRVIKETEFPAQISSISLFVIPSGGLSDIKDPEGFTAALNRFVEGGGTLFVFSQRFGKEYSILPRLAGESINGYGWLEDQSSLTHSAIVTMRHPAVSGLTVPKPHLNIDGSLISYPRNGKPLLRNSVSGQPVMLLYRHGKGNVVASALFTDWAYLHGRATWDEVALFSRFLRWVGLSLSPSAPKGPEGGDMASLPPVALPRIGFSVESDHEIYRAGSTATFTINLWNNEERERGIHVYLDGVGRKVQLLPHGSAQVTYSIPVYSSRRLWVYFYDEKEIFLQTLRKGYTVIYPEGEEKDEGKKDQ